MKILREIQLYPASVWAGIAGIAGWVYETEVPLPAVIELHADCEQTRVPRRTVWEAASTQYQWPTRGRG